jgi:hypothetical protein
VISLRIVAWPSTYLSPQAFHHEIRFQIELANEHKEFISGKKNGKINKIMQTTNVKIKFETFNEHNFVIDIAGGDVAALNGLALLQEELPAEISFHVPESYHKRIIGVGGRSIQRIMKKYGVYVKFSNAEEFAALGGYGDNEDNVIARTPAKNTINLEHLKQSVMELVHPKVCPVRSCITPRQLNNHAGQGLHERNGFHPSAVSPYFARREGHLHPRHRAEDQLPGVLPRQGDRLGRRHHIRPRESGPDCLDNVTRECSLRMVSSMMY